MFGSKGSDSGSMKGPNDVKCDKDGRYVVADTFNHRISWYDNVSLGFHLSPYHSVLNYCLLRNVPLMMIHESGPLSFTNAGIISEIGALTKHRKKRKQSGRV